MAILYGVVEGVKVYIEGYATYQFHKDKEALELAIRKAIEKVAGIFARAQPELARNGVVVRPIYPYRDLGLNVDWKWTITSTATNETNPGTLLSKTLSEKQALVIFGLKFFDVNPIVKHIGFKKGTMKTAMIDVYAEKDEEGKIILRHQVAWAPKETVEILYTASTTGDLYMAILGFIAEPKAETADWVEE